MNEAFKSLRAYFNEVLKTVDPESREWTDAFNIENIPSTIIDRSYHLSFLPKSYLGTAHLCLTFNAPVMVRYFVKGYRDTADGLDTAHEIAEAIVKGACAPARLSQAHIKNVLPSSVDVRELDASNDNTFIIEALFNVTVIIKPN